MKGDISEHRFDPGGGLAPVQAERHNPAANLDLDDLGSTLTNIATLIVQLAVVRGHCHQVAWPDGYSDLAHDVWPRLSHS
jgi:hypothetical protein